MFKLRIEGMKTLEAKITDYAEGIQTIVDEEMQSAANKWVRGAKIDAPADEGRLRNAISLQKLGQNRYEIVCQVTYAPFMEFGTKGKYRPIPGTESIAAQFKGYKGGDFMDLLRAILRWVRRKGIAWTYSVKSHRRTGNKVNQIAEDYSVAWPIAISILKNGINPHPFFFKQGNIVWPDMVQIIEKRINASSTTPIRVNYERN